jgi:translation initiation factor 2 alpha subunit (eIF-2alpha)
MEVMEKYKTEQTSKSALHSVLKENAPSVEEKILKNFPSLTDFFSKARESPELVEKYIPKASQEAISKIIQKKQKEVEVSKVVNTKCMESDGINRVRSIFASAASDKKSRVSYLAAGRFQLSIKADNYKDANHKILSSLQKIEQAAKASKCEFSVTEK